LAGKASILATDRLFRSRQLEAVIMLVLSRNPDSAIHIGSDITVKVLSIRRQAVKLGIEAPKSVPVWRDELACLADERQPTPAAIKPTAGMKIVLVIEDDPGHAKLIRNALCQFQGTMVTVAGTASTALSALGASVTSPEDIVQPDLVLLDLGLPDTSGLEVLRTIRSVPELVTTPVVVLSCNDDEKVMHECLEAGANAFVVKSANYGDFHTLVGRIGQFWAGDCLARRRSFTRRSDEFLTAPSDAAAAMGTDANECEEELVLTDYSKRILLADDDAGHVTLIKRALRRANVNCAVDVVGNGVEVVEYLFGVGQYADCKPTVMPDLVLLDLNMPEMNGRQVLQALRRVRSEDRADLPPIVVLTSSDEEADISDAYNLGAQSFIRKPAHHGRFIEAVQQTTLYWLGLNQSPSTQPCAPRIRVPR
jgi:two-component system response regulator